ncbi:MAG: 50S ribosomal protein L11, partial [Planctomycetaceae bacterium]
DRTKEMKGTTIPVIVTVYNDRSFEFILKSPPASVLLKQAAQVAKGAANPKADKVGKVSKAQVVEIAKVKFSDMNSSSIEQACKVIAGTARSMGIEITD